MSEFKAIDNKVLDAKLVGPLALLLGKWQGETGMDIAPEPDGVEENAFYETIEFKLVGDVSNAEEQDLGIVQYEQIVRRKRDDKLIHHQLGYWTWDAESQTICNGFTIPRRVSLLAGGTVEYINNKMIIFVEAENGSDTWGITEAAFMREKANTKSFSQTLEVEGDRLHYQQTTVVDIYGESGFEHTDENTLTKIS